ncbi:phage minor head protein [Klebsiella variicola]|uniref:phage head morphogenesis protein n=1 Tax=Klebsiella michiganensis TaxID=1134687 RepID=UPI0025A7D6A2|nr:phage head morphogenesis protein [Klebsiella variicola]
MAKKKQKTASSTRPNAGLEVEYRKKLLSLIDEMSRSVDWWLSAEYRRNESEIVGDASPAKEVGSKLISIMATWRETFDKKAKDIALWFVRRSNAWASNSVKKSLGAHDITVNMRVTPEVQATLDGLYEEQVNLIKSIPEQYLTQVQTMVQESIIRGRDVGYLKEELKKRYGITERRAKFIARDQNGKATSSIARRRQKAAGIKRCVLKHRAGGSKTFRESHVHADGQEYDIDVGFWDSHLKRYVQPGELPGCKCEGRPVIPTPGE